MKRHPITKEVRNLWTNSAILLDHKELERSYNLFLETTMQKYDVQRAALGVLRSQRNVWDFLNKGGLIEQTNTEDKEDASNSLGLSTPVSSGLSTPVSSGLSTPVTSSASSTSSSGRPLRTVIPVVPFFPVNSNTKKAATKTDAKKAPLRGNSSDPAPKKKCGSSSGVKKSNCSTKNPAKKLAGGLSSSSSSSSSSKSSTDNGATESAMVYKQQLVIKQLEDVLKSTEAEKKNYVAEIAALKRAAEDKSSASTLISSNNKRKSCYNIVYL